MKVFSVNISKKWLSRRALCLGLLLVLLMGYLFYNYTGRRYHFNLVQAAIAEGNYYAFRQAHYWNCDELLTEDERIQLHETAVRYVEEHQPEGLPGGEYDPIMKWQLKFFGKKTVLESWVDSRNNPLPIEPLTAFSTENHPPYDFKRTFPYLNISPKESREATETLKREA